MEKISKATAQKIVETVKEVCGCDVNFIEGKGRIIASTNQKRVGDFHEGGHLAAQRNETLEVFQDGQFPGARKGVNIPVCYQGRPGLSGTLRCLFPTLKIGPVSVAIGPFGREQHVINARESHVELFGSLVKVGGRHGTFEGDIEEVAARREDTACNRDNDKAAESRVCGGDELFHDGDRFTGTEC